MSLLKRFGPLVFVASVLAVAAWAQLVRPYGQSSSPPYDWFDADGGPSAAHGTLFDAGLSCGTANTVLADQLALVECETRYIANGVDNETSNIVSLSETEAQGRWSDYDGRPVAVYAEYVGLAPDAGLETSISSVSACGFWRAFGDGDAGSPWFFKTSQVLATGSPAGSRAIGFFTASPFQPGYYCFIPVATNPNIKKVWMRLNKMIQPRIIPR